MRRLERLVEGQFDVATVKVAKRHVTSGDGCVNEVHEFRFWAKVRALESLAKHIGGLVQSVEHAGSLDVVQRLQAAPRFTLRMISEVSADVPVVKAQRQRAGVAGERAALRRLHRRRFQLRWQSDTDRPCCVGRNSHEGLGYANVNLRMAREFAVNGRTGLAVSLDFNLFNRSDVKDVNTV